MRGLLAWGLLVAAGLPLFLGISYLMVSGFGADFEAFIALIIGLIGIGLGIVLAVLGYWFLPRRAMRRLSAFGVMCLAGGLSMLLAFLLSLIAAPVPFLAALVVGLGGLVLGGISLAWHILRPS